jgi:uncharacterized protein (DUF58 family)
MARQRRSAQRTSQGLTTRGRCLLAGGIAAIACAILLDERDLLRVGILAVALPLIAWLTVAGRSLTFTATYRADPQRLTPGASGTVELRLRNTGRRPSPAVSVTDRPVDGLTDGVRCTLPSLHPGATAIVRYGLVATRRGRFNVGDLTIRCGDPLGLCARTSSMRSAVDVVVLPQVVPLAGLPTSSGALTVGGAGAVGVSPGGDPDVRVRPYVSGDDVRTVHWRASARRGDLVVRTRQPTSHGSAAMIIDHRAVAHAGSGANSSLEIAITIAASVATQVLVHDFELTAMTHTGAVLARGTDVWDEVLLGLALLTPSETTEVTCGRPRAAALTVAVTGALTRPDVVRLTSTATAGRSVALILDVATWGKASGGSAVLSAWDAAALLRSSGWSTVVLRAGDDLDGAWRAAHARTVTPEEVAS